MWPCVAAMLVMMGSQGGPKVQADSAIVMDAGTGRVLWEKDANTPRFPASTTKILTALLLIERSTPDELITAPADVETISGASLHLKPGENVTARDMLYAIMLRSANDGCHAVALHVGGSLKGFADLMNARARQAGAHDPQFQNPHGLNDPLHKVSARDLALITRDAMRYPQFNEVVRTRRHTIQRSLNTQDTLLINRNKWLAKDPSADGVKTGWTIPSGQCYVGSATREGWRVITVIMKTENWQTDHETLLDWAFAEHEVAWRRHAGAVVGQAPVRGGSAQTVEAILGETTQVVRSRATSSPVSTETVWDEGALRAPIRKGARLGVLHVRDDDGFTIGRPIFANAAVSARELPATTGSVGGMAVMVGALLGLGALVTRRRKCSSKPMPTMTQPELRQARRKRDLG